jgi:AcrR family transcriptional regulator
MSAERTVKGEHTRQQILDTALAMFVTKGYEATTMRAIAAAVDCSLGLAYRYFARKEDLVLALYQRLAEQFMAQTEAFDPATIAVQFERAMLTKLELLTPYKQAIGALFGAAMNPQSGVAVLGESTAGIRFTVRGAYEKLLASATDVPSQKVSTQLATVLYALHLSLILFWLYDRSVDYKATRELISLARDMLALLRPLLRLPPVSSALTRLAKAADALIGSEE